MLTMGKKSFDQPEKTQNVGRAKIESVTIESLTYVRYTAEPGWQWSIDIKPVAQTESCQVDHLIYVISGTIHVRMDNGEEMEFNAGDMGWVPPGHDAWLVGDQPAVWLQLPH